LKLKRALTVLLFSLLFLSCQDSDIESYKFKTLQHIDNGEYKTALKRLEDCRGFSKNECYLNRGVSYFGLADYRIESIGIELYRSYSKEDSGQKTLSTLFSRADSDYLKLGVDEFKKVATDISICKYDSFNSLSEHNKTACLAINPLLLLEISGLDERDSSSIPVDLREIIDIQRDVESIFEDINSSQISIAITDGELDSSLKAEIDAIRCVEKAYQQNSFDGSICIDRNIYIEREEYKYIDFPEYEIVSIIGDFIGYKAVKDRSVALQSGYIKLDSTPCLESESKKLNGVCFPKPQESRVQDIAQKWSSDNYIDSIALLVNIDSSLSSENKISNFKEDICRSGNGCSFNSDGSVKSISSDALLSYFGDRL